MDQLAPLYQAGVWRYLRFLGCDATQADDLTQETFLAVIRGSFEYRGPEQMRAFLRKVARNQLLMSVRSSRREPRRQAIEAAEEVWAESIGDDDGGEYLAALDECLEELTGRSRTAIDLSYRHSASRESIAQQLNMTGDGVKTLLRRTRAALRRCVERRIAE